MKKYNKVQSSALNVKRLHVDVDTVYIRSNITQIEFEDFLGWEYDEIQYTHREYIELLAKQEEVRELESRLLTPVELYERLDKTNTPLEQLKHHKLNQLNELCNKAIISGFTYEIDSIEYLFSASIEAQSNFQATDALFKEGLIQDVEWTVTNLDTNIVERVTISQELFNTIKMVLFNHVNSQIHKYRNLLQPQVLSATTNEEVDSIVW